MVKPSFGKLDAIIEDSELTFEDRFSRLRRLLEGMGHQGRSAVVQRLHEIGIHHQDRVALLNGLAAELTKVYEADTLGFSREIREYQAEIERLEELKQKREQQYALDKLRLFLQASSNLDYLCEGALRDQDGTIEFVLKDHDARLWISYSSGQINVVPHWTIERGKSVEIWRISPWKRMDYIVSVSELDQDSPKFAFSLAWLLNHISQYVERIEGAGRKVEVPFKTGLYSIGRI